MSNDSFFVEKVEKRDDMLKMSNDSFIVTEESGSSQGRFQDQTFRGGAQPLMRKVQVWPIWHEGKKEAITFFF